MKKGPFKMKGFSGYVNSPLKKEDVVSDTSPGPGYRKIKGTNIWEHIPTKEQKRKDREMVTNITGKTRRLSKYLKDN